MELQKIPEFYAHKSIFITGASGFMGKILLEKLLRSCSDLEKIYVIVRSKRNKSPSERWKEVTNSMVFDRLKSERPGILENKVEAMEGDMTQIRLGLSDEDYQLLQEKVTVIFHVAASVRFDDPLPDSVLMNLRGTHEVIKFALGAKQIHAFVHVSTTFCNCYQTKSEEKLYPPPTDWRKTIAIAEKLDRRQASILGPKYLGVFPNTYTFTKNLAEAMIWDYRDKLPFVIMRPSIVISSVSEPIPGWTDSINGPMGLFIAGLKGVVRIGYANKDAVADYMAADIAIKSIIVAGWQRSQRCENAVPIYNIASFERGMTNGDMLKIGAKANETSPLSEAIWYPSTRSTTNKTWFKISSIFVHLLPALIVDQMMKILGKKPMLTKIQQRVHTVNMALGYFTTKPWIFTNEKFKALNNMVMCEDKNDFDFDYSGVELEDYIRQGIKVGKLVILNEDEDKVRPQALRSIRRLSEAIRDPINKLLPGISFDTTNPSCKGWPEWGEKNKYSFRLWVVDTILLGIIMVTKWYQIIYKAPLAAGVDFGQCY